MKMSLFPVCLPHQTELVESKDHVWVNIYSLVLAQCLTHPRHSMYTVSLIESSETMNFVDEESEVKGLSGESHSTGWLSQK